MFAWMNAEALALTLETRVGHFWSRSRGQLWKKGEESGNVLDVARGAHRLRPGCRVAEGRRVRGDGVACHTGARSCFYRALPLGRPDPRPEHATCGALNRFLTLSCRPRARGRNIACSAWHAAKAAVNPSVGLT